MAENPGSRIAGFVKVNRRKAQMTQEDLADRAGVGLRFVRELEQGKSTLRMDKVNQVLRLFGHTLMPGSEKVADAWDIHLHYINKQVRILLKNRQTLHGILLDHPVKEHGEIVAWRFVPNSKAIEYNATQDPALIQTILHTDIEHVENT